MPKAIEAEDLVKTYPKGVTAVDGLSFAVEPGTVFALLGPNGAGKTTAVKILTTLTRPDSGRASVGGIDVVAQPDRVRRAIGAVSQGSGVDIQATGRENARLQGQIYGLRGRALEQRIDDLLERFGLSDAADRIARGHSGEAHGIQVASVRVARPSLDDVYLRYTGRTFDAAEAEAEVIR